jgi:hypothetical protein
MLAGDYYWPSDVHQGPVAYFLLSHAGNPETWGDAEPMTGYDTVRTSTRPLRCSTAYASASV